MKWHLRLGHPGPQALEHLVNCSTGARIRPLTTVECDACGQGKVKRRIRRAPRDLSEGPGYRLAVDFHDFNRGYGGFNSLMLVTDRWSGHYWDYYLSDRKAETIIPAFKHIFDMLKRLHGKHTGKNMAALLLEVFREYKIGGRIGFFILDNASSNDTYVDLVLRNHR